MRAPFQKLMKEKIIPVLNPIFKEVKRRGFTVKYPKFIAAEYLTDNDDFDRYYFIIEINEFNGFDFTLNADFVKNKIEIEIKGEDESDTLLYSMDKITPAFVESLLLTAIDHIIKVSMKNKEE